MEHIDKILNQLVEKLRDAHGKRLRSVILYGSGATGEIHGAHSDLNVFCVLDGVTPKDLGAAETVFQWWREKGNPAPLLLSSDEVRTSTDCFPIEFHDIVERHQVLYLPVRGVAGADQRAHTGPGDHVDGNTGFTQGLDDADMRHSQRCAAAQRQSYLNI